ncbi:hypothetical protein A5642_13710 [Mycolicibacterium mucogenicum]|uniref:Uncharacterized protein n=1 Tax=Mycolicibacterium mucogenicum TaxID=56689 RepID=A0A1A0MYU3_MYCMU|nr:hypothetical protein A5642_13710 [Mycolicibacterium mucogenicum]
MTGVKIHPSIGGQFSGVVNSLGLSGINELDVYSYTGTLGTFGYMVAYMLMGLGIPILVRRLAPQAGIGAAVIIGMTVTGCLGYVFYRNVYPLPAWPAALMPWIFLAVLLAAAAWYVAGPARIARRQTREESLAEEPAPEPAR